MAERPLWREAVAAADRVVSPRVTELVQSAGFSDAVAAFTKWQRGMTEQTATSSRRALHSVNLPAATDVQRILDHLAALERRVDELARLVEKLVGQQQADRSGPSGRAAPKQPKEGRAGDRRTGSARSAPT